MAKHGTLGRSVLETGKTIRSARFQIFGAMSGLVVAACSGAFISGETDSAVVQNIGTPVAGIAWIAATVVLAWLWNLIRTPYRMLNERAIDPSKENRLQRTIDGLSEKAKEQLLNRAEILANGASGLDIGKNERGELTLAGILEVEYIPSPDPLTGSPSSAAIWRLTEFGKEVARKIRAQ